MKRPKPDELFAPPPDRKARAVPHAFVLDALEPLGPYTRPMFGCLGVYVDDKIVFILRDKPAGDDNGLWIATTPEHHASLREVLPSMRSISVLGPGVTGWQGLPSELPEFEEEAMRAVKLVLARDPRIGKVPNSKKPKGPRAAAKTAAATKPAKPAKPTKATKQARATKPTGAKPAKKKAPARKAAAR